MTYRSRSGRAVGLCWLMGGLTLTGCVAPRRGGPFGVANTPNIAPTAVHRVEQGETLYGLARRFGVRAAWLAQYNGIAEPSRLRIGQDLLIPPAALVVAPVVAAAPAPIASPPAALVAHGPVPSVLAAPSAPAPAIELPAPVVEALVPVVQALAPVTEAAAAAIAASAPAIAATMPVIAAAAAVVDAPASVVEAPLKAHPPAPKSSNALTPGPLPRKGKHGKLALQWPISGAVSSQFGRRNGRAHDGIDIRAPLGTAVCAAADGDVVFSDTHRGYGNVVILRHVDGVMTIYAHHQKNLVTAGERVRQGDVIAEVGSTGRTSGPHLHFEVRRRAQPHDPLRFLPRSSS